MERYKKLAALRCFTHKDMVRLAGFAPKDPKAIVNKGDTDYDAI